MNWLRKLLNMGPGQELHKDKAPASVLLTENPDRKEKIEKAAEDFAIRFEDVMKELAKN